MFTLTGHTACWCAQGVPDPKIKDLIIRSYITTFCYSYNNLQSLQLTTVLPQILAQVVIYFQQLSPQSLSETSIYFIYYFIYIIIGFIAHTKLQIIEILIKVFRCWILMAAGDAHVVDPLDTVPAPWRTVWFAVTMYTYKSVWLPIIEQLILEKESAGQSTRWIAVVKDSQIVGRTLLEK